LERKKRSYLAIERLSAVFGGVTYIAILQLQVAYLQSPPEGSIVPDDTGKYS
jgi:hypothetical protein